MIEPPIIKIGDYDLAPYLINMSSGCWNSRTLTYSGFLIFDLTDLSKKSIAKILVEAEKFKFQGNPIKINYIFDGKSRVLQLDYDYRIKKLEWEKHETK